MKAQDTIRDNLHEIAAYIRQLQLLRDSERCSFSHYDKEKELFDTILQWINIFFSLLDKSIDKKV